MVFRLLPSQSLLVEELRSLKTPHGALLGFGKHSLSCLLSSLGNVPFSFVSSLVLGARWSSQVPPFAASLSWSLVSPSSLSVRVPMTLELISAPFLPSLLPVYPVHHLFLPILFLYYLLSSLICLHKHLNPNCCAWLIVTTSSLSPNFKRQLSEHLFCHEMPTDVIVYQIHFFVIVWISRPFSYWPLLPGQLCFCYPPPPAVSSWNFMPWHAVPNS